MIKTILVDDEASGLYTLRQLLQEYCPELKVIAECSTADAAREKIELLEPQLVFLDISLPGKSSFELLEELEDREFEIIFVTAHNSYTLTAFRYSAIDYLVKPIDEDLLVQAVKRAIKRISKNDLQQNVNTLLHNLSISGKGPLLKLCIPSVKGFQVVELKDIMYCEAAGNYTNFYFTHQPMYCSARAIHDYEELLSDAGFVRVHKSYLINMQHIKEYIRGEGGTVIMSNNAEVEVSRRKKEIFFSRLKEYNKF